MFELSLVEKEENGFIIKTAIVKYDNCVEEKYIKIPVSEKDFITDTLDPFVVMNIYKMMRIGGDCYIRGKVNSSLITNLENFCNSWTVLLPNTYKKINIIADEEINDTPKQLNDDAIMCFSGGLDACYTAYSHFKKLHGRNNKNIKKAIFIIAEKDLVDNKEHLDLVLKNNKLMLNELNIEFVIIDTNMQHYIDDWMKEYISFFASTITLYQKVYHYGLISSSLLFYDNSSSDSNISFSNIFLGSNNFKIITAGEFLNRTEKANVIKDWELACKYLRVCTGQKYRHKNDCICEKCQRTILNFKVCGVKDFPAFPNYSIDLKNIILNKELLFKFYKEILEYNKMTNALEQNEVNEILDLINRSEIYLGIKSEYDNDKMKEFINKIAWWIPVKKWRENFRDKFKIRPDQTRPDQTRPDQTRPDLIYVENTSYFIIIHNIKKYNLRCNIKLQCRFFVA
ncbi:hypothetical protein R4Q14_14210 [Brachyspira intermedia]|uniref:hypothetical protein n=1 Tax=Brachyspira intermedia TaxID=84377 RepID=UPI00300706C0